MSLIKQVLYFDRKIDFPNTGAENVIYVALDEDYGKDYYWDGTSYQKLIGDILLYPYQNSLYENITTIGDALNYLLTPDLSVSLIVTPTYAYSTENIEVNFTWVMSKNVSAISTITMTTNSGLSVIFPDLKALTTGNVGAYSKEMMISANTTFTITIVDTSGNSASASDTIQFVPNVLNITDFAVSPEAGYDDQEYQLDFTATFNRLITAADISAMTISYSGTTVNLMSGSGFKDGVTISDYTLSVSSLAEFVLERSSNTIFTLAVSLTNSTSDTAAVTYYAVPEVSINTFTVSGEIDGALEDITISTSLTDFSSTLNALGFYSVVGTVSSDALASNITINYNTSSATRQVTRPLLTQDYDFTLTLVQRIGDNDYRYPTVRTVTLDELYTEVQITDFDASVSQALIDVPTTVTFSGAATKDLSTMQYVGIWYNEGDGWVELVDITSSVSGLSFEYDQEIDIITDTQYRLKVTEVFAGETTTVYSDSITISAVDNLTNPVYWGVAQFGSGLDEGDILALLTSEYIATNDNILSDYGGVVSQPQTLFMTNRNDLDALPGQDYYQWVAFPTESPAFPSFSVFNDYTDHNTTDFFYVDSIDLPAYEVCVSASNVAYTLYVTKGEYGLMNIIWKIS